MEEEKGRTIYDLELNEWTMVAYNVKVWRVASGWIYEFMNNNNYIFVPFDNLFDI